MKLKLRLYYRLLTVALLAVAGVLIAGIVFPAINAVNTPAKAADKRDFLKMQWLRWFCAIVNLRASRVGALPSKAALIVSNHVSWLDILLLGQYLPAYFVSKSDVADWPVFGFLSRQAGTVFIRRGDKKHILATAEKMLWLLKQNRTIIAFPEGTTTIGDDVLHFHASLFQPALLAKTAIQPVSIEYLGAAKQIAPFVGDDSFVPHLIKLLSLDKIDVQVRFLPEIDGTGKNRHAVSHEAREIILTQLVGYEQTHSA